MGTSTLEIIKILREKDISVFSLNDFRRLFLIENDQTAYKKIQRLQEEGIIETLINGKYRFTFSYNLATDYVIANYLYAPSYISLESALSYYGIITGFPYIVSSITVKKPKKIIFQNKEFSYSRVKKELFFGMRKDVDFVIAEPEKALLDYIYFGQKGLRNLEFDEMDFSAIDRKKLSLYAKQAGIKKLPL